MQAVTDGMSLDDAISFVHDLRERIDERLGILEQTREDADR